MDLHLQSLRLANFKNYETAQIEFCPQLNCMVGRNGMGKTNLLDAIYYLCMCKNHMGLTDRNVIRQGEDFFRLDGHFYRDEKIERIVAKVKPGKLKEFERQGVSYDRLLEHIGLLPIVMIVPDDTGLITEGSEERRRFLDNTLSQLDTEYLQHLLVYNRLVKQKNSLLKQFAKDRRFDEALVQIYNDQLEEPGNIIYNKRAAFIQQFIPIFEDYYQVISGDQERASCEYISALGKELSFADLLAEAMEKDRLLQRSTVGVHRDDLRFFLNDNALKRYASQGQRKSYVLALKLAQFELLRQQKEIMPLLLLDDVFDKLDQQRVEHLVGLLHSREFGQVFITDTDESRVEEIIKKFDSEFKKFVIEDGNIG